MGPESAQQMTIRREPPPTYAESLEHRVVPTLEHRVVPTAPPLPDPQSCPSYPPTVNDLNGNTAGNQIFASQDDLPGTPTRASWPPAASEISHQQNNTFASDTRLYSSPRRRAACKPTRYCRRHMHLPRMCNDEDFDLVTIDINGTGTKNKRSKKRKYLDRFVLGSWLVFWPIYLPITLMRESPADDEDIYDDILLSEAYRIGQKILPDERERHCPKCQRVRTR